MMRYYIMSRRDARKASLREEAPDTAIISITDVDSPPNRFRHQPWIKGILRLQFEDVEMGFPDCITTKEAEAIAAFALKMYPVVKQFIVHCEYGISRSSGVAAALMKYFDGNDSAIWEDGLYAPNEACYRMVSKALGSEA